MNVDLRERRPVRRAGNPLAGLRAPLPARTPLAGLSPAPTGQPAVGTVVVLAVHGWTDRDEEAVVRLVRDVGAPLVVVNNDVLSFAESAAWCEGVAFHVACVDPSFSAACNAGALLACATWKPEHLLFTQSDVKFEADALADGVARSVEFGGAAIGPSGGYLEGWPAPGPLVVIEYGHNVHSYGKQHQRIAAVDFITGYWLLVPTIAFLQAGAWDPGFALYYEDCDIALRLAMVGCRSIVDPNLAIHHERSATIIATHGGRARGYMQEHSRDRFIAKWERLCVECSSAPE